MTQISTVYLVPACNLDELEAKLEKLAKRVARLGVGAIAWTKTVSHVLFRCRNLTVMGEINHSWRTQENLDAQPDNPFRAEKTGEAMNVFAVTLAGDKPTLNGWSFVATLEPLVADGETLNLIQTLPGESCPVSFRTVINRCDHCNVNRRRTQTFVLRHEDGTHKSVGRQCIKDFLGYNADPHALASYLELLAELQSVCGGSEDFDEDGFGFGGGRGDTGWSIEKFLALTACRIRSFGWVSRTEVKDNPWSGKKATADCVLRLLTPPRSTDGADALKEWKEFADSHVEVEKDAVDAQAAIDWAKALTDDELSRSEYLANLNLLARVGVIDRKTAGLGASIVVAYYKAVEREIERQRKAARPESNWIGTVGERIKVLKVTCEKVISNEGAFGVTGIHKLVDDKGNDLTWFASESTKWIDEGATVTIAATVTKHDEYKGRKQTVVNRVAIWEEAALAEHLAKEAKKAERAAKRAAKLQPAS